MINIVGILFSSQFEYIPQSFLGPITDYLETIKGTGTWV